MPADPLERFTSKYLVNVETGCWLWTAGQTTKGYAAFAPHGRTVHAHRWSYEHFVGPIPDGLELDHLCSVRHCVYPSHLESVTHAENVRRGEMGQANPNAAKTHCPYGHEYTPENTYQYGTNRQCRTCKIQGSRRRLLQQATTR